jgi:3-phenylpropionate/trans-cinnamate dioxygenase ferredoxin subunit
MARYIVAAADEIPPGGRKIIEVAGRSIGIFNLRGEFFALRNRCPHQGGPLCQGKTWGVLQARAPGEVAYTRAGEILTCAWHGWEFDIRTGQSWCDPERLRVRRYEVRVEPGAALASPDDAPAPGMVRGPYSVETYPVTAEGRYLVVEVAS